MIRGAAGARARARHRQRGATTALAAVLLLALTLPLALLIEVGGAVVAQRELLNTADAAARAGATALDLEAYRASNGQTARLDPVRARQIAQAHLHYNHYHDAAEVTATTTTVTVTLTREQPRLIFRFVSPAQLSATAHAQPQTGTTEPEP